MNKGLIFLARLIGFHFVPENQRAAVMRLGMYHRARGPGFVWVAPLFEKVENLVKLGVRLTTFTVKQVFSSDGIPFDIELTVRYSFDPDSTSSRPIAAQLVRQPDHILENIVRDYADQSLRRTVAQYSAEDICNGRPITDIEQRVIQGLQAQVRHLGLAPMAGREVAPVAGSGVMIKEITPPPDFVETILTAKRHELILRVLTAYQEADVDQALLAEWVRNFKDVPPGVFSSLTELLKLPKVARGDEQ
jgi:regulator of protease activity HflC (stomatin/prohibitin superfamily)